MSDPDVSAGERRAARERARRLRPVTTLRDVDAAAADFIAWMRAEGWRPPLPTATLPGEQRDFDPDRLQRGVELARHMFEHRNDPDRRTP